MRSSDVNYSKGCIYVWMHGYHVVSTLMAERFALLCEEGGRRHITITTHLAFPQHVVQDYKTTRAQQLESCLIVHIILRLVGVDEDQIKAFRARLVEYACALLIH